MQVIRRPATRTAVRPRCTAAGAGRIPPVADPDRRDSSLDLNAEEVRALLDGVAALTERELAAARSAPVFERRPSAAEIDRAIGAQRGVPAEGESVDDLLAACAGVLAAGRRTTSAFFGYVQSPPAPVGVAADLLASAADQNVTSWRSSPAATAVERQTVRWLGGVVGFDRAAAGVLVGGAGGGGGARPRVGGVPVGGRAGGDPDRAARRAAGRRGPGWRSPGDARVRVGWDALLRGPGGDGARGGRRVGARRPRPPAGPGRA